MISRYVRNHSLERVKLAHFQSILNFLGASLDAWDIGDNESRIACLVAMDRQEFITIRIPQEKLDEVEGICREFGFTFIETQQPLNVAPARSEMNTSPRP